MQTKRFIHPYTFYDRTGIIQYLEEQAEKGWMLKSMSGFAWTFYRIEPRRVHFAVAYFPKESDYDPIPTEQQRLFGDYCAHIGWFLAASTGAVHIYYNLDQDPVPIETDPVIELENIRKFAGKRLLIPHWIFVIAWGLNLGLRLLQFYVDPVDMLSNGPELFMLLNFFAVLYLYLHELYNYYSWMRKAKKAAESGMQLPQTRGHMRGVYAWWLLLAWLLLLLACTGLRYTMLILLPCLITVVPVLGIIKLLRKRGRAGKATIVVASIGSVVILLLVTLTVISFIGADTVSEILDGRHPEGGYIETYEFESDTYKCYHDPVPLTVGDMLNGGNEDYSCEMTTRETVFLRVSDVTQTPRKDAGDMLELEYTIVEVKACWLYDFCVRSMIRERSGKTNETIDPALWGANAAYRRYKGDTALNGYIICYDDMIVELAADWELTEEQMTLAGQAFTASSLP